LSGRECFLQWAAASVSIYRSEYFILLVHQHDFGDVPRDLRLVHPRETCDDDEMSRLHLVGGGSVHENRARPFRLGHDVRFEARGGRDIPYLNSFERQETGGFCEVLINAYAALII